MPTQTQQSVYELAILSWQQTTIQPFVHLRTGCAALSQSDHTDLFVSA